MAELNKARVAEKACFSRKMEVFQKNLDGDRSVFPEQDELELKLAQKLKKIEELKKSIQEKEGYIRTFPPLRIARLKRKIRSFLRFHFIQVRALFQSTESKSDSRKNDLGRKLQKIESKIQSMVSYLYQLESILIKPPFFSFKIIWIHLKSFESSGINMAYLIFARNYRMRLGHFSQYAVRQLKKERFPLIKKGFELPHIAVVTPSYNQATFLEATIRSVIEQNYPNLEYHIQDGGSRDNSFKIIESYADRLTSWESSADGGQADALRKGFAKSRGEIMAWLNSDDLLMPGSLHYVGEYFAKHPEVDVLYGHRIVINRDGFEIGRWVLPPHDSESLRYADFIPQETLFWRRRLWEKVGGLDVSFRFALDWDLLLKFQKVQAKIKRVPFFLGCFRIHDSQKTSSEINLTGEREMRRIREKLHGYPIPQAVVDQYARRLKLKASFYSRLYQIGVRI